MADHVWCPASDRRTRGVISIERIDERQHIPDRTLALGRSAPRLLPVPALCTLSGRLFVLRRLSRKGGAGRFRVMHPVCIVTRYGPMVKKHARNFYAHTREECEEKLKVLIVEMKAEIAEAKRLMDLGEGDGRPPEGKEGKRARKVEKNGVIVWLSVGAFQKSG